ncbi:MAG: hypothetical protein HRF49_00995 [bacterium]|jgi:hypothetical protein
MKKSVSVLDGFKLLGLELQRERERFIFGPPPWGSPVTTMIRFTSYLSDSADNKPIVEKIDAEGEIAKLDGDFTGD